MRSSFVTQRFDVEKVLPDGGFDFLPRQVAFDESKKQLVLTTTIPLSRVQCLSPLAGGTVEVSVQDSLEGAFLLKFPTEARATDFNRLVSPHIVSDKSKLKLPPKKKKKAKSRSRHASRDPGGGGSGDRTPAGSDGASSSEDDLGLPVSADALRLADLRKQEKEERRAKKAKKKAKKKEKKKKKSEHKAAGGNGGGGDDDTSGDETPPPPPDHDSDEDEDGAAAPPPPPALSDDEAASSGDDEDVQTEYRVTKLNKFGIKQDRILSVKGREKVILVLDTSTRKVKKTIPSGHVLQLDIPAEDNKSFPLYMVFTSEAGQRPFKVLFLNRVDRVHFCTSTQKMEPRIKLQRDGEDNEDNEERFEIIKHNKMGILKRRFLHLLPQQRVIRSFASNRKFKDIAMEEIWRIEKSLEDKRKLSIVFHDRSPLALTFADATTKSKFYTRVNELWEKCFKDQTKRGERKDGKSVTIWVGTWNMGGGPPPEDRTYRASFVPPCEHDIYVVGLQECTKQCNREQFFAGLRHQVCDDWDEEGKPEAEREYVVVEEQRFWDMSLVVMARRRVAHQINNITHGSQATGVGDVLGNKGGVAVSFSVRDTHVAVVSSHLAARAERMQQRAENFQRIVKGLKLGHRGAADVLNEFHHVFWLGDLNYRVELEFEEACSLMEAKKFKRLVDADQLSTEMDTGGAFNGFKEHKITFAPTYRWEHNENVVSNKRGQPPSYTDRVLCKSLPGMDEFITQQEYGSCPNHFGSDHRPVYAVYKIKTLAPYRGDEYSPFLANDRRISVNMNKQMSLFLYEVRFVPTALLMEHKKGKKGEKDKSSSLNDDENEDGANKVPQQVSLTFLSSILDKNFETGPLKHNKPRGSSISKDHAVRSEWGHWQLQNSCKLYPFINDASYLAKQHLTVAVTDRSKGAFGIAKKQHEPTSTDLSKDSATSNVKGSVIGYSVISLHGVLKEKEKIPFRCAVTHGGQEYGELTGSLVAQYPKQHK